MSIAEFLSISQRDWTVSVIFTVTLLEVDPIFDLFSIFGVCRAKEWIDICNRPDLMQRLDTESININNFYVCELHFENQIMEFATRKILIRTAQPIPIGGENFDPSSLLAHDSLEEPAFDHVDLDQEDDDYVAGRVGFIRMKYVILMPIFGYFCRCGRRLPAQPDPTSYYYENRRRLQRRLIE